MTFLVLLFLLVCFIVYSLSKEFKCCCYKSKLKIKKVKNLEPYYENQCPICLEDLITESSSSSSSTLLNNNNEVVYLEICNNDSHPFHRKCIMESLENYGMKCPVCRATNLISEEPNRINSYGAIEEV